MNVLVTGGSGLVGSAATLALLRDGHEVRLLSRGAEDSAQDWPDGVLPFEADIANPATLPGALDGIDAVLHLAGIVREDPPEVTFQSINVEGTRNILAEAGRAGVRRFVCVSSLGTDDGETAYHESKRAAEQLVHASPLDWTIVRIGLVYGPGDEVMSLMLRMVRTLPAVPSISGDYEFQPIWHEDAGNALAACVTRTDLGGRTLEVAGLDATTMSSLFAQFSEITGRHPLRVPVPASVARLGAKLSHAVGLDIGVDASQIRMLTEGNVVRSPEGNALAGVLGVEATPLASGLELLCDAQLEQLPEEGVGPLEVKRVWADIEPAQCSGQALHALFVANFGDVMAVEVGSEPGTTDRVACGQTLTLHLPARGNIQVRCAELTDVTLTLLTLEGHPLAGAVRFVCSEQEGGVRFEVRTYARAADSISRAAMALIGAALQSNAWETTVERVVGLSGGKAPAGVQNVSETLGEEEAAEVESWIRGIVASLRRDERGAVTP